MKAMQQRLQVSIPRGATSGRMPPERCKVPGASVGIPGTVTRAEDPAMVGLAALILIEEADIGHPLDALTR